MKHNNFVKKLGFLFLTCASFGIGSFASAGSGWHGGNDMRLLFEQARIKAVSSLERMAEVDLKQINDDSIRTWLKENRFDLSSDIRKSKHIWLKSFDDLSGYTALQDKNCAATVMDQAADIYFSRSDCVEVDHIGALASQLLVHESIHHLGIADEAQADRIATAVFYIWDSLGYSADSHWLRINEVNAPRMGMAARAVWTGSKMIGWERFFRSAGQYDPSKDRWSEIPVDNVPELTGGYASEYVNQNILFWGGTLIPKVDGDGECPDWQTRLTNRGYIYNIDENSWESMTDLNAPSPRKAMYSVSLGNKLFIWGGRYCNGNQWDHLNNGGIYDAKQKQWINIPVTNEVPARKDASIVWTGKEIIIWGGYIKHSSGIWILSNTGISFNPETYTWSSLKTINAPAARYRHTALWTGGQMIVWGGIGRQDQGLADGAIYDPKTSTWSLVDAPQFKIGNHDPLVAWTGSIMIVWGGQDTTSSSSSAFPDTVAFYNPTNNTWSKRDRLIGPRQSTDNSAFWTGSEMIVWGSEGGGVFYP